MAERKIRNMEEFAALSGISRPTVSKYFHDPDSVRPKTRARIEKALEHYDYRPNIFAINQNRRQTNNVGIVVPYLTVRPTLYSPYGDSDLEVEILETIRQLKPAGVLLAPLGRLTDRAAVEKFCAEVPTVLFDSEIEGIGQAFVGSDNFSFVSQTVDYLVRTGTPPCFFEMRTPANPNANKRRLAYIELMEKLGAAPRVLSVEGEGWAFEEIGREGALRILEGGGFPGDTVLCSNDRLAIGLLSACYEKGLRVGRSEGCALRVASHDDHPFSRFSCPSLTTAAHDYDSVSEAAMETLTRLIEAGGGFVTREVALYPAKLILRSSA
jgi:DNA-binding LacI/PurR family transcriptional regulator